MGWRFSKYSLVYVDKMRPKRPPKDEYDPLSVSDGDASKSFRVPSKGHNWNLSRKLAVGCGGIVAVGLGAVFMWIFQQLRSPSQLQCAKLNSAYSPAWNGVSFWEGDFDNEFPHKTLYRGPPTPEREQAWTDLWLHTPVVVPEEGIGALNKTGRDWVKSDDGEGYVALLEVFHQLHCLNIVRQYTWLHLYSEEDIPVDLTDPVGGRMHVDHCIETLRLSLMCYADVTPLLVYLDPDAPIGRRADFDVHHKCRDFNRLVEYVDRAS